MKLLQCAINITSREKHNYVDVLNSSENEHETIVEGPTKPPNT